jgi:hypothetical protein
LSPAIRVRPLVLVLVRSSSSSSSSSIFNRFQRKRDGNDDKDDDEHENENENDHDREEEHEHDSGSCPVAPGFEIRQGPDTEGLEFLLSLRLTIYCFMDPNQKDEPPEEIAGKEETVGFDAASLQAQEHSFALGDAQTVMRRFNRTTTWVATGLLSTLVVAAGVLVFQDNHPMAANIHEEARSGGLVSEGSPDSPSEVVDLNGKNPDQTTSGQLASSYPGVAPEANNGDLPTKVSESLGAQRQESPRAIRPRIHNLRHRLSFRSRAIDVKMRLIMLWHQSLARAHGWTLFSSPHHARSKKVSNTIETSH